MCSGSTATGRLSLAPRPSHLHRAHLLHHEVTPAHLTGVTVSMRVMSAGDGYKYLLQSVAAGDGNRPLTTPLIAYYTEKGTPPGSIRRSLVPRPWTPVPSREPGGVPFSEE